MIARRVQVHKAAPPSGAVPDPNVGWWKFHEHDQQSSIPNAVNPGVGDMSLIGFNVSNWTTQNGRPAYRFPGTSDNYGQAFFAHGIGSGPFTVAIRIDPLTFAVGGQAYHTAACFGQYDPSLKTKNFSDNFCSMYWGVERRSDIVAVGQQVNWFIFRKLPDDSLHIFHNSFKSGLSFPASRSINSDYFGIATANAVNGSVQVVQLIIDEARIYNYDLTDQQCFDLMLDT